MRSKPETIANVSVRNIASQRSKYRELWKLVNLNGLLHGSLIKGY